MDFGRIVDGTMIRKKYSTPVVIEGVSYITNDENLIRRAGYKELVYTPASPEAGYCAVSFYWLETDTQYIQTWTYEPILDEAYEPTIEDRLEAVEMAMLEMLGVEM